MDLIKKKEKKKEKRKGTDNTFDKTVYSNKGLIEQGNHKLTYNDLLDLDAVSMRRNYS